MRKGGRRERKETAGSWGVTSGLGVPGSGIELGSCLGRCQEESGIPTAPQEQEAIKVRRTGTTAQPRRRPL